MNPDFSLFLYQMTKFGIHCEYFHSYKKMVIVDEPRILLVAKQPHSLRRCSLLHLTHIRSYPQKGVTKGPV